MKSLDIIPAGQKKVLKKQAKPVAGRNWYKVFVIVIFFLLVLVTLFVFLILPEARIQVTLRTEPVTRDFDVRVNIAASTPDATDLVIPGRIVQEEIAGGKTFAATGSKNVGRIASGFVYVYNFSKTTLILKKETTVLRVGDKKYFFTQDVGNIRPTAFIGLEQQEIDPSSLIPPVPVVAEAPGEVYNLPEGTRLEIENEVFGKQPKVLYAVVAEQVSGGTTKEIKVVKDSDIVAAYSALTKELVESAGTNLASQNPNSKLLDNAVVVEVLEQKSSVAAGTEIPEFTAELKIKLLGLVFDEDQLRNIVVERISRLLPENKILQDGEGSRLQSKFLAVNLEQGMGVLNTHFEGQIVYQIDKEVLLEKIKNKSQEEIQEVMLSRPEIAEITVKFYPFWVHKTPKFVKRIKLELISP